MVARLVIPLSGIRRMRYVQCVCIRFLCGASFRLLDISAPSIRWCSMQLYAIFGSYSEDECVLLSIFIEIDISQIVFAVEVEVAQSKAETNMDGTLQVVRIRMKRTKKKIKTENKLRAYCAKYVCEAISTHVWLWCANTSRQVCSKPKHQRRETISFRTQFIYTSTSSAHPALGIECVVSRRNQKMCVNYNRMPSVPCHGSYAMQKVFCGSSFYSLSPPPLILEADDVI